MRNRTIIYMKNAEIAFLPPFGPGVFLLMAIYRLALEKWQAICNTCYIYYTTNHVPYDDLYLSGNQSDDMPETLISEQHLSSGTRFAIHVIYIIHQIACHMMTCTCPATSRMICPSRLSPSRICQVACDTHTHTHTHVYYTTNRMPSVVYTCPIVPARQPSDYMFETIIIQSYLSSTRPMHETRVPYKIPPGALNKTYSQFIPAQSKDLSLTHYTLQLLRYQSYPSKLQSQHEIGI